ncbi:MAG TPA: hypothetical protein VMC62_03370, partial [Longilinea sp.]|nr:hypothetical protein [Longilinea sp.]
KYEMLISLALIVLVGCITYLPYINQLGFYFNDWRAMDSQVSGVSLVSIFSTDRPLMGWHWQIMLGILGNSLILWHLYLFILRIGGALLLFWVFRMLWHDKKLITTAMTVLFLVYPGFLDQVMPLAFHTHLTVLLLAILSNGLTIASFQAKAKSTKITLAVLSVITGIIYLIAIDYFAAMEAARLAIIFILYFREHPQKFNFKALGAVFIRWLPYFVMTLVFLIYRLFIFHGSRETTDVGSVFSLYLHQPVHMLLQLVLGIGKGAFDTLFSAWFVPLYQTLKLTSYSDWVISIILAGVAAGIFLLFAHLVKEPKDSASIKESADHVGVEMMILGAVTLFAGVFIIIAVNRPITFNSVLDRYTMPAFIGTVLLIGGAILQWIDSHRFSVALFSFLIVISIVAQINNTIYYRDDWAIQRNLWWQITWRAPAFKDGTVLMIDLPSPYYFGEDEETFAPANYIYYPQPNNFHIYSEVLNPDTVIELAMQSVSERDLRTISFVRDFSKAVIAAQDSAGGCVHIYDSQQIEISTLDNSLNNIAAQYSKIDQIVTTGKAPTPPADVFGKEPAHTWCYYYQKASLARQQHDWAEVARLGDEAIAHRYNAYDPLEWVPFMEGYINVGREADALQILTRIPYGYDRISECTSLKNGGGAYSTGASLQRLEQMFCENR